MIARQTRVTVAEGALVGGPFIVLIPVAWCAALLAQAQMVFELAALAGHSPTDEMRAVDLLVLQGAYSTSADAGAALARVTNELPGKRLPRGTRIALIRRMAYMLGLIGVGDAKPNVLRSILGWIFVGVVFVVGVRAALRLDPLHGRLDAEERGGDRPEGAERARRARGGFLRMALLLCAPVGIAVVAFASGGPVAAGIVVFLAVAFLLTSVWIGFRWWRRRRQVDSEGT